MASLFNIWKQSTFLLKTVVIAIREASQPPSLCRDIAYICCHMVKAGKWQKEMTDYKFFYAHLDQISLRKDTQIVYHMSPDMSLYWLRNIICFKRHHSSWYFVKISNFSFKNSMSLTRFYHMTAAMSKQHKQLLRLSIPNF